MFELPSLRPETVYGMPVADQVIFNRYFGAKFELLPDRSFFSTPKFLYKFHDVTDRVRTPSK